MAKHKIQHFHGPRNGHKRTTYIQQAQYVIQYPKPIPKRQLGLMLSAQRNKVISVILLSI